jgi:hypothetical protein
VEELSMELLNLVNTKALLMRQLQNLGRAKEFAGDPEREVERIKAMVDRSISARYKVHVCQIQNALDRDGRV